MRDRGKRKLIMYGLMVALMVTTVAYAVLQTTLNINGTVTKKGGSWDIHFANLSTPSLTGDASSTNANIQATSFTFSATVEKPKDAIVYTFDVVNGGSIDATLDSITLSGATEAKAQDITYTLTYADGKAIAKGDKLVSGQTRSLKLTVSYDDVDALSAHGATLNLGATLIYVQTEDAGTGSLVPETPVLTSVTLIELKNAGKLVTSFGGAGLGNNSLFSVGCEEIGYPDYGIICNESATITLNSYAKFTGTASGPGENGAKDDWGNFSTLRAIMSDGSKREIKYSSSEMIEVGTASEYFGNGYYYYIDDVAVEYLGYDSIEFSFEGEMSTFFAETSLYGHLNFSEILIEE